LRRTDNSKHKRDIWRMKGGGKTGRKKKCRLFTGGAPGGRGDETQVSEDKKKRFKRFPKIKKARHQPKDLGQGVKPPERRKSVKEKSDRMTRVNITGSLKNQDPRGKPIHCKKPASKSAWRVDGSREIQTSGKATWTQEKARIKKLQNWKKKTYRVKLRNGAWVSTLTR